jgi:LPS-assembly lipoprotein
MQIKYALFAIIFALSACGFEPVYGVNRNTAIGVEDKLAQIEIENIPDREGQFLRNALITNFYREGRPASPRLKLNVSAIQENNRELDITKNADATRGQLSMQATIVLSDSTSGEMLLQRRVQSTASYNILTSEFANRVSEQNTRENALTDLARQIEQHVVLYLKKTQ